MVGDVGKQGRSRSHHLQIVPHAEDLLRIVAGIHRHLESEIIRSELPSPHEGEGDQHLEWLQEDPEERSEEPPSGHHGYHYPEGQQLQDPPGQHLHVVVQQVVGELVADDEGELTVRAGVDEVHGDDDVVSKAEGGEISHHCDVNLWSGKPEEFRIILKQSVGNLVQFVIDWERLGHFFTLEKMSDHHTC